MYKLIALDVDGTLVGHDCVIPAHNRAAVAYALSKGLKIVLASGRSYKSLKPLADELNLTKDNDYIISFNGCTVHTNPGSPVLDLKIPITDADGIIGELLTLNPQNEIIIYHDIHETYAINPARFVDMYIDRCKVRPVTIADKSEITQTSVYKIIAFGETPYLKTVERHFTENPRQAARYFTDPNLYEFCHPQAGKGAALAHICRLLQIVLSETIAVGDSDNDISMLETAAIGAAMITADEKVKRAADYITSSVAEVIEKYVLP
jgi:hypothetical protein